MFCSLHLFFNFILYSLLCSYACKSDKAIAGIWLACASIAIFAWYATCAVVIAVVSLAISVSLILDSLDVVFSSAVARVFIVLFNLFIYAPIFALVDTTLVNALSISVIALWASSWVLMFVLPIPKAAVFNAGRDTSNFSPFSVPICISVLASTICRFKFWFSSLLLGLKSILPVPVF